MTILYLNALSSYTRAADGDEKSFRAELKRDFGIDGRRLSRFTLLATAGATKLLHTGENLPADSGVYLASSFSSPAKFANMLDTVMHQRTPKPFDFIGNIHNAAAFHTAQALGISGTSQFMAVSRQNTSWPQILLPAWLDLHSGNVPAALIGWCHEYNPLQTQVPYEGSHWLLLTRHPSAQTLCTLQMCQTGKATDFPDSAADAYLFDGVEHLFERLQQKQSIYLPAPFEQHFVFEPFIAKKAT